MAAEVDGAIALRRAWDAAEPGKGYTEKAAEWRAKLETLERPTGNGE